MSGLDQVVRVRPAVPLATPRSVTRATVTVDVGIEVTGRPAGVDEVRRQLTRGAAAIGLLQMWHSGDEEVVVRIESSTPHDVVITRHSSRTAGALLDGLAHQACAPAVRTATCHLVVRSGSEVGGAAAALVVEVDERVRLVSPSGWHTRGAIEELARQLRATWLALGDPDAVLDEIRLPPEAVSTPRPPPSTEPVVLGFVERARRQPDAIAVRHGHEVTTYHDLDARSTAIARALQSRGVGRGDIVGLAVARGPELVAALLGTWKARAAYVPLDLTYPKGRLEFMLRDANCALVMVDGGGTALPDAAPLLDVRTIGRENGSGRPGWDLEAASLVDRSHIIYTSGSTGQPKGVEITHSSVAHLCGWAAAAFDSDELAGVLFSTSICFDLSIFELVVPLLNGGMIVVAASILELPELDGREVVTLVNTVPSGLAGVLRLGPLPASVRTVCVAGEPFPASLVRTLASTDVARALNLYGPSEDTTYSTVEEVDLAIPVGPPIGCPLPGTCAHVLDRDLRPVAMGMPGELFLGGPGLARGYHGRPSATADRFIPDPFSEAPGARLYRTGDEVRRLPEGGRLAYLGRLDRQVKVRGYRIELDDVTSNLVECPGVRDAGVVVATAGDREPELVAFLELDDAIVDIDDIRSELAARIPPYMVPRLVAVDTVLRTPNGKLDTRGLLARVDGPAFEAAPDRESIASIWCEVLGVETIDRDRTFIESGGDSLSATRVLGRIEQRFGVRPSVREFFDHGTVRELERFVEDAPRGHRPTPGAGAPERDVLSGEQENILAACITAPDDTSYNGPYVVWLDGEVDTEALCDALNDVVVRHETLRTAIVVRHGEPAPRVDDAARLSIPVERCRTDQLDARARARVRSLRAEPFDLTKAPLLRAHVVHSQRRAALCLTIHHLVFDAWSLSVFVRDLAAFYSARVKGEAPDLPSLVARYRDHARRRRAEREDGSAGVSWRRYLAGAPSVLRLAGTETLERRTTAGESMRLALDRDLSGRIKRIAQQNDVTPYMFLLAAFCRLLSEETGRRDMIVGTAAAGRVDTDSEELIGCFVRMLPIRVVIEPGDDLLSTLRRVRSSVLEALSAPELRLGEISREVAADRRNGVSPLVQVAFGVWNAPRATRAESVDLTLRGEELDPVEARLDLTLWVEAGDLLELVWTWSSELYERGLVGRLERRFIEILRAVSGEAPGSGRPDVDRPRRSRVRISGATLVSRSDDFPVVYRAGIQGVDPGTWCRSVGDPVGDELRARGAALFTGFDIGSIGDFRAFVEATSEEILPYVERSSPRTEVEDGIYTSTDHPPDQPIVLHTEQSYTTRWPMRLYFHARRVATEGGRTPLADTRRVLRRLSPSTVDAFERRGVRYVRNYGDGLSLDWRETFQTSDRDDVARICRSADIEIEWIGRDRLRTWQVRPAIRTHPITAERVWFNHALFFNVRALDPVLREQLLSAVGEDWLPYNTYFGDGAAIPAEVIDEVRDAIDCETVRFDWAVGDVLVVDNMLCAHGREAYEGQRDVVVAMTDSVAADR